MKPKPANMKAEHFVFCKALIRSEFRDVAGAYREAYPDANDASAVSAGHRLLKDVEEIRKYLADAVRNSVEASNLEVRHIIDRMLAIAFTNVSDVASWDDESGLRLKPSAEIPPRHAPAIAEVYEHVNVHGARLGVKLHNPSKILNMLGQYLRMFSPDDAERQPGEEQLQEIQEIVIERPEVGPSDDKPKALAKPKRKRRRA